MKILSIYSSMPSSVSIYVDGKIIAATHEERFTRSKNDEAFPKESIQYCLKEAKLNPADLDAVAIASFLACSFEDLVTRKSRWSTSDYLKEQHFRWLPVINGEVDKAKSQLEIFREKVDLNFYPDDVLKNLFNRPQDYHLAHELREKWFADFLGIPVSKVRRIEHHKCHAYYAYYASPFRNEKVLALTVDGSGDGLNATIGHFDEAGQYFRHYETSDCNIARIYRYMTLLLGMKPNEHEYKVMGLAPYGKPEHSVRALDVFKQTLQVDGIEFKWNVKPSDSYFWFREHLEGERFDTIAYALQTWTEDLLLDWVENAVKKYGIRKVVIAGGVAMNIKAMGKIANADFIEDFFIGGSASDESMALSAGICLAEEISAEQGIQWKNGDVKPLRSLYLGPEATAEQEKKVLNTLSSSKYEITNSVNSKQIAELLASNHIIARCAGRMEFGQRALGNRSILADPQSPLTKEKINAAIKNRDFWMPFAPIILDTFVEKYIVNPNKIDSPHMTIGFETTEEGYQAMRAACHPSDRTARAQILTKDDNPELYEIMQEFSLLTGRGALLNTSFNLHGYPIVNTPQEAIYVLDHSGLDGVLLNSALVVKK